MWNERKPKLNKPHVNLNYPRLKNCNHFKELPNLAKNKNQEKTNTLTAQAANLTDLIDYQEGSVVSRIIIDKKAGTITLFAFDNGQGLSEHTAPYDALVCVLDGEAEVTISGKPIRLKKGELTIMPANEPHALSATTKFKMLLVMIRS
jgi:quercetin dioxygenase-like cupin family protein